MFPFSNLYVLPVDDELKLVRKKKTKNQAHISMVYSLQ